MRERQPGQDEVQGSIAPAPPDGPGGEKARPPVGTVRLYASDIRERLWMKLIVWAGVGHARGFNRTGQECKRLE